MEPKLFTQSLKMQKGSETLPLSHGIQSTTSISKLLMELKHG